MKKIMEGRVFIVGMIISVIILNGCSKKDDAVTPAPVNPYGGSNGQVTFWCSNVNTVVYPVTITIDGTYVGTIGGMITTQPDCNNTYDRVVKYVAGPGTYNVFATTANGGNWSGSFNIATGGCLLEQLK